MICMARTLGAPHQCAGRKGRGEQIEGIALRRELPVHATHHVHDVTVALDGAIWLHAHAAGVGHAPEVIARQVHQHHVLGVLLGIGEQLRFARAVGWRHRGSAAGCRRWAAAARAAR